MAVRKKVLCKNFPTIELSVLQRENFSKVSKFFKPKQRDSARMSTAAARKQDLPPEGGYKKIPYVRIPAKSYFNGYQLIAGFAGVSAFGIFMYYQSLKEVHRNEVEMRSARNVILPILTAERDREFLKQLRRNRDEEAKLMAKVDGWKVGTWYGEPIYKTLPPDTLIEPMFNEFYVHSDYKAMAKRANFTLWT